MTKSSKSEAQFTPGFSYKEGDLFTIPGYYKRRTFWQWITRKPKELRMFRVITASTQSGGLTEYEPVR